MPLDPNATRALIAGAGPDVFDRALQRVDQNRIALLDATAAQGAAGQAAYQQSRQRAEQMRQSAIDAALAEATRRGAPQATLTAIQEQISRPFQDAALTRDQAAANWQNLFGALGQAGSQFHEQYAASLPLTQQMFRDDLASRFAEINSTGEVELGRINAAKDTELARLAFEQAMREAQMRREDARLAAERAFRQDEFLRQAQWRQEDIEREQARYEAEAAARLAREEEDRRRWEAQMAFDRERFEEQKRQFDAELAARAASRGGGGGSRGGGGGGGTLNWMDLAQWELEALINGNVGNVPVHIAPTRQTKPAPPPVAPDNRSSGRLPTGGKGRTNIPIGA